MSINIRIKKDIDDLTGLIELQDFLKYLSSRREGIELFFSSEWWIWWMKLKAQLDKFLIDWGTYKKNIFKTPYKQYEFIKSEYNKLFDKYFGDLYQEIKEVNENLLNSWPLGLTLAQIKGDISYLAKNLVKCAQRHKFEIMNDIEEE